MQRKLNIFFSSQVSKYAFGSDARERVLAKLSECTATCPEACSNATKWKYYYKQTRKYYVDETMRLECAQGIDSLQFLESRFRYKFFRDYVLNVLLYLYISVDCEWGMWNHNECSQTCGVSASRRLSRGIDKEAAFGGMQCLGPSFKYENCSLQPCSCK